MLRVSSAESLSAGEEGLLIMARLGALALCIWIGLSATATDCTAVEAEKRQALVIGNGAYADGSLDNPPNDAREMARALRQCGFEVIEKIDCNRKDMEDAVRDFGMRIKKGGVGLFYYAGHGMQVEGSNYLIPVGADVQAEDEVKYKAMDAGMVLSKMESAGNRINIVILDACRNNPFARSFRSGSRGLKKMDAPKGTLLAYATAPGDVAADGKGQNGLYTSRLLKHLRTPGLAVEQVFKRVRDDVMKMTGDSQVPWESTSLRGDFYFVSGDGSGPPALAAPPPPPAVVYGHLQVNVNVAGSKVYVDGSYRGVASPGSPLNLKDIGPGAVEVKVEADGYYTAVRQATLSVNQWTQLVVELTVVPPPAPPVQKQQSQPEKKSKKKADERDWGQPPTF